MSIRSERTPRTVAPPQLKLFSVADIARFFDYTEKTFHLSPRWRAIYERERNSALRGGNEVEFFFAFIAKNIEPALKQLLARADVVTHALCRYLIQDRLDRMEKNEDEIRAYEQRHMNRSR